MSPANLGFKHALHPFFEEDELTLILAVLQDLPLV
jgi:hypothetical protein